MSDCFSKHVRVKLLKLLARGNSRENVFVNRFLLLRRIQCLHKRTVDAVRTKGVFILNQHQCETIKAPTVKVKGSCGCQKKFPSFIRYLKILRFCDDLVRRCMTQLWNVKSNGSFSRDLEPRCNWHLICTSLKMRSGAPAPLLQVSGLRTRVGATPPNFNHSPVFHDGPYTLYHVWIVGILPHPKHAVQRLFVPGSLTIYVGVHQQKSIKYQLLFWRRFLTSGVNEGGRKCPPFKALTDDVLRSTLTLSQRSREEQTVRVSRWKRGYICHCWLCRPFRTTFEWTNSSRFWIMSFCSKVTFNWMLAYILP